MKIPKIKVEDAEGVEHELPTKFAVCGRCEGTGTHVNPSIDGHGIGAEEWERDWDDDSREGYFSGRYDVRCEECRGERVVAVVDEETCPPKLLDLYREQQRDIAENYAMEDAERRMGA